MRNKIYSLMSLLVVISMLFTACTTTTPTEPQATEAPVVQTVIVAGTPQVVVVTPTPR